MSAGGFGRSRKAAAAARAAKKAEAMKAGRLPLPKTSSKGPAATDTNICSQEGEQAKEKCWKVLVNFAVRTVVIMFEEKRPSTWTQTRAVSTKYNGRMEAHKQEHTTTSSNESSASMKTSCCTVRGSSAQTTIRAETCYEYRTYSRTVLPIGVPHRVDKWCDPYLV